MIQSFLKMFFGVVLVTLTSYCQSQTPEPANVEYGLFESYGAAFPYLGTLYQNNDAREEDRQKELLGSIDEINDIISYMRPYKVTSEQYLKTVKAPTPQTGLTCFAHALRTSIESILNANPSKSTNFILPSEKAIYTYLRKLQAFYLPESTNTSVTQDEINLLKHSQNKSLKVCVACKKMTLNEIETESQEQSVELVLSISLAFRALQVNGLPIGISPQEKFEHRHSRIYLKDFIWLENTLLYKGITTGTYARFPLLATKLASTQNEDRGVTPQILQSWLDKRFPIVALLNTSSSIFDSKSGLNYYTGGPVGHAVVLLPSENPDTLLVSDSLNISGSDSSNLGRIEVPMSNFIRKLDGLFLLFGLDVEIGDRKHLVRALDYDSGLKSNRLKTVRKRLKNVNDGFPHPISKE